MPFVVAPSSRVGASERSDLQEERAACEPHPFLEQGIGGEAQERSAGADKLGLMLPPAPIEKRSAVRTRPLVPLEAGGGLAGEKHSRGFLVFGAEGTTVVSVPPQAQDSQPRPSPIRIGGLLTAAGGGVQVVLEARDLASEAFLQIEKFLNRGGAFLRPEPREGLEGQSRDAQEQQAAQGVSIFPFW